jgi:hypothetical protein
MAKAKPRNKQWISQQQGAKRRKKLPRGLGLAKIIDNLA